MSWGDNTEFTENERADVEIDKDGEHVDRDEEGAKTTADFDIDDAVTNLD